MVGEGDDIVVRLRSQPCVEILFAQNISPHEAMGLAGSQGRTHPDESPAIKTVSGLQQMPMSTGPEEGDVTRLGIQAEGFDPRHQVQGVHVQITIGVRANAGDRTQIIEPHICPFWKWLDLGSL